MYSKNIDAYAADLGHRFFNICKKAGYLMTRLMYIYEPLHDHSKDLDFVPIVYLSHIGLVFLHVHVVVSNERS